MTGTILERSLHRVARRLYQLRVLRRQALCWVLLLVPAIALALMLPPVQGPVSTPLLVLACTTVLGIILARINVGTPTALETARLIEKCRPELNDALLTAVQTAAESSHRRPLSVLDEWTIREAEKLAHCSDWKNIVPSRDLLRWTFVSFLAFIFLISTVVATSRWSRDHADLVHNADNGTSSAALSTSNIELVVEPGDVEIERGTGLTVVARFQNRIPADVVLIVHNESTSARYVMEPTVDKGVFAFRIPSVDADADYHVRFADSPVDLAAIDHADYKLRTPDFHISTYELPRVERVDARIQSPAYTGRNEQLIEDTLRVTVVEGATVDFLIHTNKPIPRAELQTPDGQPVPLSTAEPRLLTATVTATEDRTYRVILEDADGRRPKFEEEILLRVSRNQRPKIRITFPGRDTSVSPLQEFHVEAEATDDFGLTDYGVVWAISNGRSGETSLAGQHADSPNAPPHQVAMQYMIDLESLNAQPDELVTWHFYAEDIAADGSPRRTSSDMMFAEVRRFEEIFRQAQQQGQQQQQQQGQQGQQNQTDQLLDLQRQIMIATWNIQRSLNEATSRDAAAPQAMKDADVVLQSQQQALQQLQTVMEKAADDPQALQLAATVDEQMNAALSSLQDFRKDAADTSLQQALAAQQAAIAGLMRMRAREHEVRQSRSQSGQSQSRQNSASQQQLQQLELDNDRNRYESERQAQQQQQTEEQRQQLQILNRLKELARRQQMLNERLKQLESELRAATSPEERQKIERELKRLREEQREMLRDVDELRETMDQQSPQTQQQNQQTRQQVEEARERVQQASRAMDTGQLSQAISEGTRAERKFDQLQEQFRQQTSGQFTEAMRDLRQQARELQNSQRDLARELADDDTDDRQPTQPSLRSNRDRDKLENKVAEQRDRLQRVLEQAKQVVQEAEESEPLLSRRLYDTIRDVREKKPEEALEAAEILVSRGLWNQSRQAEEIARQGIDRLTQGIEKAADAVLGSEAESLRRAQSEIRDLADQLSSEIAQATGQNPGQEGDESSQNRVPGYDQQSETKPQDSPSPGPSTDESKPDRQGSTRRAPSTPPNRQSADTTSPTNSQPADQQRPNGSPRQPRSNDPAQNDKQNPQDSAATESNSETSERAQQRPSERSSAQSRPSGQGQQKSSNASRPSNSQQEQQEKNAGQNSEQNNSNNDQSPGQPQDSQSRGQQGQQGQPNAPSSENQSSNSQQNASQGRRSFLLNGGRERDGQPAKNQGGRPLTGDDYRDWSNRMREVEEILDDPELRSRIAQVRDRARSIRAEFRRHGKEPQWDLVRSQLLGEMLDLQHRLAQELSRLESDRSLAPIDNEPVPEEFDELVRRYYELLGRSRQEQE